MKRICALWIICAVLLAGCGAAGTPDAAKSQQTSRIGTATQPQSTGDTAGLTREDAKRIALQHAGLEEQQVVRLRTEYEIDDGITQYDVEFYHNGIEYSYEIHARTGQILSADKDRND